MTFYYLQNPSTSIPLLLDLLTDFGKISGYKVNWSKTEIMPISRFNSDSLQNQFNWRWSYSSIRYLGVNIPAKMEDAFNLNYPPLVQKVLKDLEKNESASF